MNQRFLIVDDARISRLRLRAALEALGECEILEVPNLARAREVLSSGPWAGVFCDLLLPDGDGFSLLESLPSDGPQRFVYSCRVNGETLRRAEALGALLRPLVAA